MPTELPVHSASRQKIPTITSMMIHTIAMIEKECDRRQTMRTIRYDSQLRRTVRNMRCDTIQIERTIPHMRHMRHERYDRCEIHGNMGKWNGLYEVIERQNAIFTPTADMGPTSERDSQMFCCTVILRTLPNLHRRH